MDSHLLSMNRTLGMILERHWIQVLFDDWFETCIPELVRQECSSIGFSPIAIHSEFANEVIVRVFFNRLIIRTCVLIIYNCDWQRTWINRLLAQAGSDLEAHLVNNIPDNLAAGSRTVGRACTAACPDIVVCRTPLRTAPAESHDEVPSARHPLTAPMAWAWADIPVHIQLQYRGGILQPEDRVGDGLELKAAADHLSQCALECFDRQHRTRLFMVSITGRTARLVCADRAGIVVSAPLDYVEDPTRLGMFFYAYSRMTPEERGFDLTASPATSEEAELFRQLARDADPGSAVGCCLELAVTPGWRIFALDVYAPWSPPDTFLDAKATTTRTTHRCLVGRPATAAGSVCGRGNRGFVAYDTTERQVVWIKDGWRPMSADIPSEFDNYQTLYGKISRRRLKRGFLTLRAGGDVLCPALPEASESAQDSSVAIGAQTTITHDAMIFSPDRLPPALPLRHTRLVFKEVCRTLEEFSDAVELILAVGGALVGTSSFYCASLCLSSTLITSP